MSKIGLFIPAAYASMIHEKTSVSDGLDNHAESGAASHE